MLTRRDFLKVSMASGAAAALASTLKGGQAFAAGTPNIAKFTNRIVHPIPKLEPDTTTYPGADYYQITMSEGSHRFHSQLGVARTLRYGAMPYLGPTIEARRGRRRKGGPMHR